MHRSIYLLNSPVLTGYGVWRFEGPIAPERARELVTDGFRSAIGHAGAAELLSLLLDSPVPVARIRVDLAAGERALVLRLRERLPENSSLSHEQMLALPFELGLLERLE